LTIDYCQRLDETIRRTDRVFQAGTQRRSVANFHQAVQLAQNGKLGKIHTLYASVYVPSIETTWLPGEPTPDPKIVDWNLWLGPAPWRPYNHNYVEGRWRGYYDFDSGARLLDWGAHTIDLCQWANQADETMPVEFEVNPTNVTAMYANGVKLIVDFLATPFGERPGWIQRLDTCPVRFEGDDGWVETGDNGEVVTNIKSLQSSLSKAEREVGLDVGAHARNFLDCIKSRRPPNANSQVMRRSHIACHAAAVCWMLGRPLAIDPVSETFINDDEANRLRSRPARDWT
jgi:predicted dehydrogenase